MYKEYQDSKLKKNQKFGIFCHIRKACQTSNSPKKGWVGAMEVQFSEFTFLIDGNKWRKFEQNPRTFIDKPR